MRQVQAPSYAVLFQRLFAFYDAHECHGYGCTFEEAYQRAELASVRLAESAEALRVRPPESEFPALHERAERESLDLAAAAQRFERRLRAG
ncbi:MAG: hypothetical protein ABI867_30210 [Kofleriaceae bacterium]